MKAQKLQGAEKVLSFREILAILVYIVGGVILLGLVVLLFWLEYCWDPG